MSSRIAIAVIACVAIGLVTAESRAGAAATSPTARQAYERARGDYFTLKGKAERQKFRHNWLKVIAGFSEVASRFPDSSEAPAAVYTTAELWADLFQISRRDSDLDQALAGYERVVSRYPESTLADDALYHRAEIYLKNLKNRPAAARAVRELLTHYKDGDMAPKAAGLAKELADVPDEPASPEAPDAGDGAVAAGKLVGHRDSAGPAPLVTELRHWSDPTYSRVAIYLSAAAQAHVGSVPATTGEPARVFVDIRRARLAKGLTPEIAMDDDLVERVRLSQREKETVRAVFDVKAPVEPRVMVMENPYRVVIDVFTAPAPEKPSASELRGRHVVVDAGHGGKDTGARGPTKLREKEIVLRIAQEVAKRLEAAGVKVTLTRDADTTVSLEQRTALANRLQADAFVSIHANSNTVATVNGIETYYLDVTDDAYALRLAAVENQTSEEQVSDLQLILADLATKVNTDESVALARAVQTGLVAAATGVNPRVKDLGVKPSLFYVLLGARMPAILVETGFMSNTREGKLLASEAYQQSLAAAVAEAVVAHLKESRAPGE